ncbi:MAG: sensor protein fixL, partial [Pedosphaera sp.]|nr:sensor protein fixL [Pedosphaera sp.]
KIIVGLVIRGESIVLSVEDNGVGFPLKPSHKTGMGLHIMNYRARMIGAALTINRKAGGGTILTCALPRTNAQPRH